MLHDTGIIHSWYIHDAFWYKLWQCNIFSLIFQDRTSNEYCSWSFFQYVTSMTHTWCIHDTYMMHSFKAWTRTSLCTFQFFCNPLIGHKWFWSCKYEINNTKNVILKFLIQFHQTLELVEKVIHIFFIYTVLWLLESFFFKLPMNISCMYYECIRNVSQM